MSIPGQPNRLRRERRCPCEMGIRYKFGRPPDECAAAWRMVFVCSRSRIVDHVPGRVPDGDALDRRGIDEVQIAQVDYSIPQLGALRADEMDGVTDDSTARGEGIGRHERETAETQRGYSFHG